MDSTIGLMLLGLLLLQGTICHTENALQCYSCIDPLSPCNETTRCHVDLDTCAIVVAGPRTYHQCWKSTDCTFSEFFKRLDEPELNYACCQENLCNSNKDIVDGGNQTGKSLLVVLLILVAVCLLILVIIWNWLI
ncbi:hypothetical protein [Saguinine gammaherpesvirus 1]|uniref:UPAR/Ly6 domain-containing protein n=1 Tax=Saguinine gammaherpesvirus 1 TaxID=2169901 RepID=A0A9Q8VIL9_9GAMA|nr:hypothetical protein [Saguinine gammaherpesvirus 1]